jgi:AhpD family alkylhydroperoxidase
MTELRKAQPDAMQGFGQLAKAAMTTGAVSEKHKELMALAIGITQHCSGCIGFHVKALLRLGCSRQELEETLAVCVYMGGGPALMYASEALKAWETMAS